MKTFSIKKRDMRDATTIARYCFRHCEVQTNG